MINTLNNNHGSALIYIIVALSVTEMESANDLKSTVSYSSDAVLLLGAGSVKEETAGKKCITFKQAGAKTIAWDISTGIADSRENRLKCLNPDR